MNFLISHFIYFRGLFFTLVYFLSFPNSFHFNALYSKLWVWLDLSFSPYSSCVHLFMCLFNNIHKVQLCSLWVKNITWIQLVFLSSRDSEKIVILFQLSCSSSSSPTLTFVREDKIFLYYPLRQRGWCCFHFASVFVCVVSCSRNYHRGILKNFQQLFICLWTEFLAATASRARVSAICLCICRYSLIFARCICELSFQMFTLYLCVCVLYLQNTHLHSDCLLICWLRWRQDRSDAWLEKWEVGQYSQSRTLFFVCFFF